MSEIKVKRARQSNWSSLETTIFIDLCKTHKVLEKMDGKRFRWADVLAPIALEMSKHEHNFQRDTSQLMIKLKSLQKLHREALAHNNKSGNSPSNFMFFSEMEDLCGSRPRNVFPMVFGVEKNYDEESVQSSVQSGRFFFIIYN